MKISSKKNGHFDRDVNPADTYLRDYRNRSSLFDKLEEGGHRPTSSFSSNEIAEQENERGVSVLQDRVSALKMLTADIHDEVNGHNRLLERMEQDMDSSRGVLAGTMDRFRRVLETKSGRSIFTTVAALVIVFLLVYYFLK
ncbi:unnamed protein product [Calypogeia fissa]